MNFEYDLELKSWVGKIPILLVKLQSNCLKQVDHHVNVHLLPTDLSSNTLCIKLELSFSCTLQLSMCNSVLFCSGVVDNHTLQYNSSRVVDLGCSLASETDGVDALGGEGEGEGGS